MKVIDSVLVERVSDGTEMAERVEVIVGFFYEYVGVKEIGGLPVMAAAEMNEEGMVSVVD